MKIGVLALQGGVSEHVSKLRNRGVTATEVREVDHLSDLDGLILPGGESTALERLTVDMFDELKYFAKTKPVWGTCAGLIFLAKSQHQKTLGMLDVQIDRNAYGSQLDSFIAPIELDNNESFEGVFIRAPKITSTGENVETIATYDEEPVAVRQSNLLASSFHPELSEDDYFHRLFVDMVKASRSS